MTDDKKLKRAVRARMSATGETYAKARNALLAIDPSTGLPYVADDALLRPGEDSRTDQRRASMAAQEGSTHGERKAASQLKGIILAGGTGSRLSPLTKITNKHLLPIADRPMVAYAIEALVQAGITEVMLVTGGTHAGEFLRLFGNGHEWGLHRLQFAYQESAGGIAEALSLAQRFADGDPVVVLLADNVFERSITPSVRHFTEQDVGARVLLSRVEDPAHLRHLGVARFESDRIVEIIEKPEMPPSDLVVTGAYLYDATVFDVLPRLVPSARGELEITDVNNHFIGSSSMEYDIVDGFWGDAGESIDAYYEVNDFVRKFGANK